MPKPKPRFRRWTADTEVAFLMALRLTGSVTRACAEIGRSTHGANDRRHRLPDFAARWQKVLDEWQAEQAAERQAASHAEGARAMPNRARYDGFTPLRQRAFLRVLTETGKYEEACRQVGVSTAAARVMRRRYPAFQAACDRALARSPGALEQVAIERAVEGVEEQVWHAGKVVGTRRRYSEVLLRSMVTRNEPPQRKHRTKKELREAAAAAAHLAGGSFIDKPWRTDEEVFAKLGDKLDKLERHLRRKGAGKAAAQAVTWLAEGKIP